MDIALVIAVLAGAYLLGSIPSSYLVGRFAAGIDIRERGSGNAGVSNLSTQVGKRWAIPAVVFDVLAKGLLPVLVASDRILGLGLGAEVAAGIAGILGHNWSVFSRFHGGRGMTTMLGATLALSYPLLLVYGAIPALGVIVTPWKDSAVWFIIAVVLLPVWSVLLNLPDELVWYSIAFVVVTALKRMTSNSVRDSSGNVSRRLLWTRLVFDRDISSREDWVKQ